MNFANGELLGSATPRLFTPPLRDLSEPDATYGHDLNWFAEHVLETPFDPWQEGLSLRVGELLPDGRPRFRHALVIVARQNGKSLWGHALIKYWLFVERVPLVLGTSTDRSYAKRAWSQICADVKDNPHLKSEIGPKGQRLEIGAETLTTLHRSEYIIGANNGRLARSTTLHRWLCDELREHSSRDAWDSATGAMNAVPHGQVVAITNQGDSSAIVLDSLRDAALSHLETGDGDPRLGLFEWSAPSGCEPDDVEAIRAANPNVGHRIEMDTLIATARRAKRAGGLELAGYRTEILCQRVEWLDAAIDPALWDRAGTDHPLDLAQHRDKVCLGLDVSLDGSHATLVAAAEIGGRVHVEVVAAWDNTADMRYELGDIATRIRARRIGWLPSGPAAAIAPDLKPQRGVWPPRGTELVEVKSETTAVCMGFDQTVRAGLLTHPRDELLDAHIRNAQRVNRGDGWIFGRRGSGPVDGAYAAATAVHLARTLPPPKPALAVV